MAFAESPLGVQAACGTVEDPGEALARRLVWIGGVAITGYLVLMTVLVATGRQAYVSKTALAPVLLFVALTAHRFRAFVQDWVVFLSGVVLFDAVRGFIFAATIAWRLPVYWFFPAQLERALTGYPALGLPLQAWASRTGAAAVLTPVSIVLHASHFAFFLVFGVALWTNSRRDFARWALVMLAVMGAGLLCYAALPAVPPWLAGTYNIIPRIPHLAGQSYSTTVPTLQSVLDTNPVAAMPSLHMAFPAVCALAARRSWGAARALLWLYVAAIAFALVYLGEHYAVDVAAGLAVAVLAWTAVSRWPAVERWIAQDGWCRWTPAHHCAAATVVVLAALLLSAWTIALVPSLGL